MNIKKKSRIKRIHVDLDDFLKEWSKKEKTSFVEASRELAKISKQKKLKREFSKDEILF